jgi:hypothetical protein
MDEVVDDIMNGELRFQLFAGVATVLSTGMAVGYVTWALRGASLASSLLAHLPVWQLIDPILVLETFDKSRAVHDNLSQDESIESMVSAV